MVWVCDLGQAQITHECVVWDRYKLHMSVKYYMFSIAGIIKNCKEYNSLSFGIFSKIHSS